MRVAVLVNPTSGRGRGVMLGPLIADALKAEGHEPRVAHVGRAAPIEPLHDALHEADVAVIAGGDGTLHHATPLIMRFGAAIYHFPLGTENLFARRFGMRADIPTLVRALAGAKRVRADVATVTVHTALKGAELGVSGLGASDGGGPVEGLRRHALLMMGIGPDGGIVRSIAMSRTGPITHATYVRPSLAQFFRPTLPTLSVTVDGVALLEKRRGWLIVANCREYGGRLDPCPDASMHDGLLDVAFFPASNGVSATMWAARARTRTSRWAWPLLGASVVATGKLVRVRSEDTDPAWQIDGEHGEHLAGAMDATVGVIPNALDVLTP
jgi:diacylglycerol kinase (ATP)